MSQFSYENIVPGDRGGKAWKYRLTAPYSLTTDIFPPIAIHLSFVSLSPGGRLTMAEGYAWDGASGPTLDDVTNMRGSGVHDAFYAMGRAGVLPARPYRKLSDQIFRVIIREDGMPWWRASYYYTAVRWGAGPYWVGHQTNTERGKA